MLPPKSAIQMIGQRVGVLLGDDRLLDLLGQEIARARDAIAHVVGGGVDVAPELELDR